MSTTPPSSAAKTSLVGVPVKWAVVTVRPVPSTVVPVVKTSQDGSGRKSSVFSSTSASVARKVSTSWTSMSSNTRSGPVTGTS